MVNCVLPARQAVKGSSMVSGAMANTDCATGVAVGWPASVPAGETVGGGPRAEVGSDVPFAGGGEAWELVAAGGCWAVEPPADRRLPRHSSATASTASTSTAASAPTAQPALPLGLADSMS